MDINVGPIIRCLRKSKGISATFMANKLGFKAVSSYTRLERENSNVTLEQAKKIADLLHVDVNEFFNIKNLRETRNKIKEVS